MKILVLFNVISFHKIKHNKQLIIDIAFIVPPKVTLSTSLRISLYTYKRKITTKTKGYVRFISVSLQCVLKSTRFSRQLLRQ